MEVAGACHLPAEYIIYQENNVLVSCITEPDNLIGYTASAKSHSETFTLEEHSSKTNPTSFSKSFPGVSRISWSSDHTNLFSECLFFWIKAKPNTPKSNCLVSV